MFLFNKMDRQIIATEDGSHTLWVPELNEHFHSMHGAIQESVHVFISNGLEQVKTEELVLFEVGFGTGLNALLTLIHQTQRSIRYISIEKYPLQEKEYSRLNYSSLLGPEWQTLFFKMHQAEWNRTTEIRPGFSLQKIKGDLAELNYTNLPRFNLIYFDAFAPGKQPEMWDEKILRQLAAHTREEGHFTTYCAQGEVRRRLSRCGFQMHRIPGPPGKREMLVGEKRSET